MTVGRGSLPQKLTLHGDLKVRPVGLPDSTKMFTMRSESSKFSFLRSEAEAHSSILTYEQKSSTLDQHSTNDEQSREHAGFHSDASVTVRGSEGAGFVLKNLHGHTDGFFTSLGDQNGDPTVQIRNHNQDGRLMAELYTIAGKHSRLSLLTSPGKNGELYLANNRTGYTLKGDDKGVNIWRSDTVVWKFGAIDHPDQPTIVELEQQPLFGADPDVIALQFLISSGHDGLKQSVKLQSANSSWNVAHTPDQLLRIFYEPNMNTTQNSADFPGSGLPYDRVYNPLQPETGQHSLVLNPGLAGNSSMLQLASRNKLAVLELEAGSKNSSRQDEASLSLASPTSSMNITGDGVSEKLAFTFDAPGMSLSAPVFEMHKQQTEARDYPLAAAFVIHGSLHSLEPERNFSIPEYYGKTMNTSSRIQWDTTARLESSRTLPSSIILSDGGDNYMISTGVDKDLSIGPSKREKPSVSFGVDFQATGDSMPLVDAMRNKIVCSAWCPSSPNTDIRHFNVSCTHGALNTIFSAECTSAAHELLLDAMCPRNASMHGYSGSWRTPTSSCPPGLDPEKCPKFFQAESQCVALTEMTLEAPMDTKKFAMNLTCSLNSARFMNFAHNDWTTYIDEWYSLRNMDKVLEYKDDFMCGTMSEDLMGAFDSRLVQPSSWASNVVIRASAGQRASLALMSGALGYELSHSGLGDAFEIEKSGAETPLVILDTNSQYHGIDGDTHLTINMFEPTWDDRSKVHFVLNSLQDSTSKIQLAEGTNAIDISFRNASLMMTPSEFSTPAIVFEAPISFQSDVLPEYFRQEATQHAAFDVVWDANLHINAGTDQQSKLELGSQQRKFKFVNDGSSDAFQMRSPDDHEFMSFRAIPHGRASWASIMTINGKESQKILLKEGSREQSIEPTGHGLHLLSNGDIHIDSSWCANVLVQVDSGSHLNVGELMIGSHELKSTDEENGLLLKSPGDITLLSSKGSVVSINTLAVEISTPKHQKLISQKHIDLAPMWDQPVKMMPQGGRVKLQSLEFVGSNFESTMNTDLLVSSLGSTVLEQGIDDAITVSNGGVHVLTNNEINLSALQLEVQPVWQQQVSIVSGQTFLSHLSLDGQTLQPASGNTMTLMSHHTQLVGSTDLMIHVKDILFASEHSKSISAGHVDVHGTCNAGGIDCTDVKVDFGSSSIAIGSLAISEEIHQTSHKADLIIESNFPFAIGNEHLAIFDSFANIEVSSSKMSRITSRSIDFKTVWNGLVDFRAGVHMLAEGKLLESASVTSSQLQFANRFSSAGDMNVESDAGSINLNALSAVGTQIASGHNFEIDSGEVALNVEWSRNIILESDVVVDDVQSGQSFISQVGEIEMFSKHGSFGVTTAVLNAQAKTVHLLTDEKIGIGAGKLLLNAEQSALNPDGGMVRMSGLYSSGQSMTGSSASLPVTIQSDVGVILNAPVGRAISILSSLVEVDAQGPVVVSSDGVAHLSSGWNKAIHLAGSMGATVSNHLLLKHTTLTSLNPKSGLVMKDTSSMNADREIVAHSPQMKISGRLTELAGARSIEVTSGPVGISFQSMTTTSLALKSSEITGFVKQGLALTSIAGTVSHESRKVVVESNQIELSSTGSTVLYGAEGVNLATEWTGETVVQPNGGRIDLGAFDFAGAEFKGKASMDTSGSGTVELQSGLISGVSLHGHQTRISSTDALELHGHSLQAASAWNSETKVGHGGSTLRVGNFEWSGNMAFSLDKNLNMQTPSFIELEANKRLELEGRHLQLSMQQLKTTAGSVTIEADSNLMMPRIEVQDLVLSGMQIQKVEHGALLESSGDVIIQAKHKASLSAVTIGAERVVLGASAIKLINAGPPTDSAAGIHLESQLNINQLVFHGSHVEGNIQSEADIIISADKTRPLIWRANQDLTIAADDMLNLNAPRFHLLPDWNEVIASQSSSHLQIGANHFNGGSIQNDEERHITSSNSDLSLEAQTGSVDVQSGGTEFQAQQKFTALGDSVELSASWNNNVVVDAQMISDSLVLMGTKIHSTVSKNGMTVGSVGGVSLNVNLDRAINLDGSLVHGLVDQIEFASSIINISASWNRHVSLSTTDFQVAATRWHGQRILAPRTDSVLTLTSPNDLSMHGHNVRIDSRQDLKISTSDVMNWHGTSMHIGTPSILPEQRHSHTISLTSELWVGDSHFQGSSVRSDNFRHAHDFAVTSTSGIGITTKAQFQAKSQTASFVGDSGIKLVAQVLQMNSFSDIHINPLGDSYLDSLAFVGTRLQTFPLHSVLRTNPSIIADNPEPHSLSLNTNEDLVFHTNGALTINTDDSMLQTSGIQLFDAHSFTTIAGFNQHIDFDLSGGDHVSQGVSFSGNSWVSKDQYKPLVLGFKPGGTVFTNGRFYARGYNVDVEAEILHYTSASTLLQSSWGHRIRSNSPVFHDRVLFESNALSSGNQLILSGTEIQLEGDRVSSSSNTLHITALKDILFSGTEVELATSQFNRNILFPGHGGDVVANGIHLTGNTLKAESLLFKGQQDIVLSGQQVVRTDSDRLQVLSSKQATIQSRAIYMFAHGEDIMLNDYGGEALFSGIRTDGRGLRGLHMLDGTALIASSGVDMKPEADIWLEGSRVRVDSTTANFLSYGSVHLYTPWNGGEHDGCSHRRDEATCVPTWTPNEWRGGIQTSQARLADLSIDGATLNGNMKYGGSTVSSKAGIHLGAVTSKATKFRGRGLMLAANATNHFESKELVMTSGWGRQVNMDATGAKVVFGNAIVADGRGTAGPDRMHGALVGSGAANVDVMATAGRDVVLHSGTVGEVSAVMAASLSGSSVMVASVGWSQDVVAGGGSVLLDLLALRGGLLQSTDRMRGLSVRSPSDISLTGASVSTLGSATNLFADTLLFQSPQVLLESSFSNVHIDHGFVFANSLSVRGHSIQTFTQGLQPSMSPLTFAAASDLTLSTPVTSTVSVSHANDLHASLAGDFNIQSSDVKLSSVFGNIMLDVSGGVLQLNSLALQPSKIASTDSMLLQARHSVAFMASAGFVAGSQSVVVDNMETRIRGSEISLSTTHLGTIKMNSLSSGPGRVVQYSGSNLISNHFSQDMSFSSRTKVNLQSQGTTHFSGAAVGLSSNSSIKFGNIRSLQQTSWGQNVFVDGSGGIVSSDSTTLGDAGWISSSDSINGIRLKAGNVHVEGGRVGILGEDLHVKTNSARLSGNSLSVISASGDMMVDSSGILMDAIAFQGGSLIAEDSFRGLSLISDTVLDLNSKKKTSVFTNDFLTSGDNNLQINSGNGLWLESLWGNDIVTSPGTAFRGDNLQIIGPSLHQTITLVVQAPVPLSFQSRSDIILSASTDVDLRGNSNWLVDTSGDASFKSKNIKLTSSWNDNIEFSQLGTEILVEALALTGAHIDVKTLLHAESVVCADQLKTAAKSTSIESQHSFISGSSGTNLLTKWNGNIGLKDGAKIDQASVSDSGLSNIEMLASNRGISLSSADTFIQGSNLNLDSDQSIVVSGLNLDLVGQLYLDPRGGSVVLDRMLKLDGRLVSKGSFHGDLPVDSLDIAVSAASQHEAFIYGKHFLEVEGSSILLEGSSLKLQQADLGGNMVFSTSQIGSLLIAPSSLSSTDHMRGMAVYAPKLSLKSFSHTVVDAAQVHLHASEELQLSGTSLTFDSEWGYDFITQQDGAIFKIDDTVANGNVLASTISGSTFDSNSLSRLSLQSVHQIELHTSIENKVKIVPTGSFKASVNGLWSIAAHSVSLSTSWAGDILSKIQGGSVEVDHLAFQGRGVHTQKASVVSTNFVSYSRQQSELSSRSLDILNPTSDTLVIAGSDLQLKSSSIAMNTYSEVQLGQHLAADGAALSALLEVHGAVLSSFGNIDLHARRQVVSYSKSADLNSLQLASVVAPQVILNTEFGGNIHLSAVGSNMVQGRHTLFSGRALSSSDPIYGTLARANDVACIADEDMALQGSHVEMIASIASHVSASTISLGNQWNKDTMVTLVGGRLATNAIELSANEILSIDGFVGLSILSAKNAALKTAKHLLTFGARVNMVSSGDAQIASQNMVLETVWNQGVHIQNNGTTFSVNDFDVHGHVLHGKRSLCARSVQDIVLSAQKIKLTGDRQLKISTAGQSRILSDKVSLQSSWNQNIVMAASDTKASQIFMTGNRIQSHPSALHLINQPVLMMRAKETARVQMKKFVILNEGSESHLSSQHSMLLRTERNGEIRMTSAVCDESLSFGYGSEIDYLANPINGLLVSAMGLRMIAKRDVNLDSKNLHFFSLENHFAGRSIALQTSHPGHITLNSSGRNTHLNSVTATSTGLHARNFEVTSASNIGFTPKEADLEYKSNQEISFLSHHSIEFVTKNLVIDIQKAQMSNSLANTLNMNDIRFDGGSLCTVAPMYPAALSSESISFESPTIKFDFTDSTMDMSAPVTRVSAENRICVNGSDVQVTGSAVNTAGLTHDGVSLYRRDNLFNAVALTAPLISVFSNSLLSTLSGYTQIDVTSKFLIDSANITVGTGNGTITFTTPNGLARAGHVTLQGSRLMTKGTSPLTSKAEDVRITSDSIFLGSKHTELVGLQDTTMSADSVYLNSEWNQGTSFDTPGASSTSKNLDSPKVHSADLQHGLVLKPESQIMTDAETLTLKSRKLLLAALGVLKMSAASVEFVTKHDGSVQVDTKTALEIGAIRIDGTSIQGTSAHTPTLIKSDKDVYLNGPRLTTLRGQQFRTVINGVGNMTTGSALIKSKATHLVGTKVQLGTIDFQSTLIHHSSLSLQSKGDLMLSSDPWSTGTEVIVNAKELFVHSEQEALVKGGSTILTADFNGNVTIKHKSMLDRIEAVGSSLAITDLSSFGAMSLNAGQESSIVCNSEYVSVASLENLDLQPDAFIIQTHFPNEYLHLKSGNVHLSSATINVGNLMGSNGNNPLSLSSSSGIVSNPQVLNFQAGQVLFSTLFKTGLLGDAVMLSSSWSNVIEFIAGKTTTQDLRTHTITNPQMSSLGLTCSSDSPISIASSSGNLQSSGQVLLEAAQDIQIDVPHIFMRSQWNENITSDVSGARLLTNGLVIGAGKIGTADDSGVLSLSDLEVADPDSFTTVDSALVVDINGRFKMEAVNLQLNASWNTNITISASGGTTRIDGITLSKSELSTVQESFQVVSASSMHLHAEADITFVTNRLVLDLENILFSNTAPTYLPSLQAEASMTIGGAPDYLSNCNQSCLTVAESKSLHVQSLSNHGVVNITAGGNGSALLSIITHNSAGKPTILIQSDKSGYKLGMPDSQTLWLGDTSQTVGLEFQANQKLKYSGQAFSAKALRANRMQVSQTMDIISSLRDAEANVWSRSDTADVQVRSQIGEASVEVISSIEDSSHSKVLLVQGNKSFSFHYQDKSVVLSSNKNQVASLHHSGSMLVTGNMTINSETTKPTSFTVNSTRGSSAFEVWAGSEQHAHLKLSSGPLQAASVLLGTQRDMFMFEFDPEKDSLSLRTDIMNNSCIVSQFDFKQKTSVFNTMNTLGSFHSGGSVHLSHLKPVSLQLHGTSASVHIVSGQNHDSSVSVIGGASQRLELMSGKQSTTAVASFNEFSLLSNNTRILKHDSAGSMFVHSSVSFEPSPNLGSFHHVHGTSAYTALASLRQAGLEVSSSEGSDSMLELNSGLHGFQISHRNGHLAFGGTGTNSFDYLTIHPHGNVKTARSLLTSGNAVMKTSIRILGEHIHMDSTAPAKIAYLEMTAREGATLRVTSSEPPTVSLNSGGVSAYLISSFPSEGLELASQTTNVGMQIGNLTAHISGNLCVHNRIEAMSTTNPAGATLLLQTDFQHVQMNVSRAEASIHIGPASHDILRMQHLLASSQATTYAASNLSTGSLERTCQDYMNDANLDGYALRWNNHCYYLSANVMNISASSRFCESNGGYLATVGDDTENIMASSLLRRMTGISLGTPAFIGYTDVGTVGKFRWITGETLISSNGGKYGKLDPSADLGYFGHGNKQNSHTKHCVILGSDGTWALADCDAKHLALCEVTF